MVVYKLGVGGEGDLVGEGGLFSVWEGVWEGGLELGDVENGVYPSELLWEADCNGVHARGAYYLEWSQVLLHQFPQRSGCAEDPGTIRDNRHPGHALHYSLPPT